MDPIDLQITRLLEENGRLSHEEISKLLHISRPAVHQRVAKLEKNGIIRGYRGIVDWSKLEQKIKAYIYVKMKCLNFKEISGQIVALQVPNVTILECQRLAGEWCMMLKVRVSDPGHITNLIDEMVKIDEVLETSTTFILSTVYENGQKEN
ncbi:Lrp/AsnC family transcriptional regulator [Paenibacillus sp. UNC499MF]|uniref:Lrp/AsnC family transcriptional regulator n=1 Tax=Paenibacillus sp. UNC499MF TaxID=1502751 RepID=UPI00089FDCF8|nr:Lrp/AsnC family transcriptional regulator [Paenibacillus sp. UNC499MF]SEG72027.1 Lrp/AsnC family transcriptional regulator, leucine-responsive regulatory protein [Paenibacillus sp. UNC499MF]